MADERDLNQNLQEQDAQSKDELSTEELDNISGGPIYMDQIAAKQLLPAVSTPPNLAAKGGQAAQH
jgi:bacteriocin-like protein